MTGTLAAVGPDGFGAYRISWQDGVPVYEPTDDLPEGFLVPGFVDIHIHGAFGIDFMSATHAEMLVLGSKLAELGYEKFLPTTVTAPAQDIATALENLPDHPMIEGFHLEGPFISPVFPGAQPIESIANPVPLTDDWNTILQDPRLIVATLAPEIPGASELIERLVASGVIVSLGHSDASYEQANIAFEAGATNTTHTYNAMRALHHREPGLLGAALTDDRVTCELIYDGHHVSKAAAEILLRCKGLSAVVAVSDSSAATGLPDGTKTQMWGHECIVSNGTVRLATNGVLAGSSVTLLDCFRNLHSDFGPEVAIRACSINPRRVLGTTSDPVKTWLLFDHSLDLVEIHRPYR